MAVKRLAFNNTRLNLFTIKSLTCGRSENILFKCWGCGPVSPEVMFIPKTFQKKDLNTTLALFSKTIEKFDKLVSFNRNIFPSNHLQRESHFNHVQDRPIGLWKSREFWNKVAPVLLCFCRPACEPRLFQIFLIILFLLWKLAPVI